MPDLVKLLIMPDAPKEAPTIAARLGRVIHWAGIVLAACIAMISLMGFLSRPEPERLILILVGMAILLVGRAFRYVLAQE